MATQKKKKEQITAVYTERPDKPTVAVSGAWGGPSSDGASVAIHLYTDWASLPSLIRYEKDGDTAKEVEILRQSDVTREVQVSLMMPASVADSIGKMMVSKAKIILDPKKPAKKKSSGRAKKG